MSTGNLLPLGRALSPFRRALDRAQTALYPGSHQVVPHPPRALCSIAVRKAASPQVERSDMAIFAGSRQRAPDLIVSMQIDGRIGKGVADILLEQRRALTPENAIEDAPPRSWAFVLSLSCWRFHGLREMIGLVANRMMALEVEGLTGAAYGERCVVRVNQRNGYGERAWETRGLPDAGRSIVESSPRTSDARRSAARHR